MYNAVISSLPVKIQRFDWTKEEIEYFRQSNQREKYHKQSWRQTNVNTEKQM